MPDRRTPFNNVGEKQTLVEFLDYLRDGVIHKVEDLTDEQARATGVPSGTSLLWLVKHLALVERAWFRYAFDGQHGSIVGDDGLLDTDTVATVLADYRDTIAASNAIVETATDLDKLCAHKATATQRMSLRWVLVHMVEETARHAGHADILREQIDGATGR